MPGHPSNSPRRPAALARLGGADDGRRYVVAAIDPQIVESEDWPDVGEAMRRAEGSGYDLRTQIPRLAAADGGLDARWPGYDLCSRLLEDCEAALTPEHHDPEPHDPVAPVARDVLEGSTHEMDNLSMHQR